PVVGRDAEMAVITEAWTLARTGRGRVVSLSGEPGIGKSRLMHAAKELVSRDSDGWLTEFHCSPYHQNTALYPVIDFLERVALAVEPAESAASGLAKLESFLMQYGIPRERGLPLFASLLALPFPETANPVETNPAKQRQQLLEYLVHCLLVRS